MNFKSTILRRKSKKKSPISNGKSIVISNAFSNHKSNETNNSLQLLRRLFVITYLLKDALNKAFKDQDKSRRANLSYRECNNIKSNTNTKKVTKNKHLKKTLDYRELSKDNCNEFISLTKCEADLLRILIKKIKINYSQVTIIKGRDLLAYSNFKTQVHLSCLLYTSPSPRDS